MTAQRTTMKIDLDGLHGAIWKALDHEEFEAVSDLMERMLGYAFDAKAWFEDVLDNQGVDIWDELNEDKQSEIIIDLIHEKAPRFATYY